MSGKTPRKLGVTGAIGAGKSTWVRGEMARRGWRTEDVRGFRTYWEGSRGAGGRLCLATWDGRVLWRGKNRPECGRPDAEGLADAILGVLSGEMDGCVLVIDELGMFEAGDARLAAAVKVAVAGAERAIVVVQARARGAWRRVLDGLEEWRVVGGGKSGAGKNWDGNSSSKGAEWGA